MTKHTGLAPQEGVGINENGNKGTKKPNRKKPAVGGNTGGNKNANGSVKNGGFKKPAGSRPSNTNKSANKGGQGQQAKRGNKR